jgi:hypothetical protein
MKPCRLWKALKTYFISVFYWNIFKDQKCKTKNMHYLGVLHIHFHMVFDYHVQVYIPWQNFTEDSIRPAWLPGSTNIHRLCHLILRGTQESLTYIHYMLWTSFYIPPRYPQDTECASPCYGALTMSNLEPRYPQDTECASPCYGALTMSNLEKVLGNRLNWMMPVSLTAERIVVFLYALLFCPAPNAAIRPPTVSLFKYCPRWFWMPYQSVTA